MNHQSGIFKTNSKIPNSIRSLARLLCHNFIFSLGVCLLEYGMFHVTEAGYADLCGVVTCFRGGKPSSREMGPPEQSQRDLRRPLAQPRPFAAPQKIKAVANPVFQPSSPPKPHEHQPSHDLAQKFDRFNPSLLPAWSFGVAPATQRAS